MTDSRFIQVSVADGLAVVNIDRPPLNILNIATLEQLERALDDLRADASVRLLMVTASGSRAFCAGVEIADHGPDKVDRMIGVFHGAIRQLEAFPVPTLAAINATALGGGLEVALACDLIVAAAGAKLGQPEIGLAVFPPVAAVLLPRRVPPVRANELLFGGGAISAEEALDLGLVNRVLPRESFSADVHAFAATFLQHSRAALLSTKKAMRAAAGRGFEEALSAAEAVYLDELMRSADAKEGLDAFVARRKPVWKHR